jgi:polar amino acid transport system substrate-binding protein
MNSFFRNLAAASCSLLAVMAVTVPYAHAEKIGDCEVTGKKGSIPIKPAVAGQLTVETNLPAPGWWDGDSPDAIKSGYEYCMAANMAHLAGLDKVKVVNVSFDALVAGQTKDFDIALAEISITPARKKVVDFSVPYFDSDIGVMVKKGEKFEQSKLKDMRVAVMQGTTGAAFTAAHLHPKETKVFPDMGGMTTALMANQVDAIIHDTSIVLGAASQSHGALVVPDQYHTGESYGALYPKGSPNGKAFDKMIEEMKKDGTLEKLAQKYLADAWGADPTKIPYIKP